MATEDIPKAAAHADELHDRLVRAAYGLHFSCENVAQLIEAQEHLVTPPAAIDYKAEAKRWHAASDQALRIVRTWETTVLPETPPHEDTPDDAVDRLADMVIHELFRIGFALEAIQPVADGVVRERVKYAVERRWTASSTRSAASYSRRTKDPRRRSPSPGRRVHRRDASASAAGAARCAGNR